LKSYSKALEKKGEFTKIIRLGADLAPKCRNKINGYIYSRWTFVPILSTSLDIGTSDLNDAILDFSLPVCLYNIFGSPIG